MKKHLLWTLLLAVSLLAGCRQEPVETAGSSCSPPPAAHPLQQHPKDKRYRELLEKYTQKGIPGLVLLVKEPTSGSWTGAAGYASLEGKVPLQPCNLMYSASVGKIYCAAAIMLLIQEGRIDPDARMDEYLPKALCDKLPNGHTATVRQLLNHTAGIPNVDDEERFGTALLNAPLSLSNEKILSFIYHKKPEFSAGTRYHYSSTGYELLARIIEAVTGQPHAFVYTERMFKPLQLAATFYKNEPGFPLPAGTVNCYFERFGNGRLENVSKVNNHLNAALSGSDGVLATVHDYGMFLESLLQGQLVTPATLNSMSWVAVDSAPNTFYGFGMYLRPSPYGEYVGHGGRSIGAGIDCYYFPRRQTTIVLATNLGTYLETPLTNQYSGELWPELLNIVFE